MKKIILFVALAMVAGPAKAESSLFNFGDFFHSIHAGNGRGQHGQKSDVFYTAIITVHNGNAVDLLSFNIGYEGILKRPTLMTGIRMDSIVPLLFNNEWGKKHVTTAKLPTFEFGPFLSAWPNGDGNLWHLTVRYGIGAAIGF